MTIKTLSKRDLETVIKLYIEERDSFCELVSLEEFVEEYVKKCEHCGEFFVTDMNYTVCEDCEYLIEKENEREEDDFATGYFEANKEHYIYNMY